jgi:hypothetical protein
VQIDAKAAEPLDAVRSIGNVGFAIKVEGVAGERWQHRGFDFRAIQDAWLDLADFAIHTHAWRGAGNEKQVAGTPANEHG